jgi:GMP synthase (glutamine-hydrolysing)
VITVVHNSAVSPAGRLVPVLERAGLVVNHVIAHRGEGLPYKPRAVVILGGEMGAYDEGRHPFLRDEKTWIRGLVDLEVPVLGLCLGAQLIADATGGGVHPAETPQAALLDLTMTETGAADPVLGGLRSPVLSIRGDTFDLPREGVLLATGGGHPMAFRVGSALGVQFHPEIPASKVVDWCRADLRPLVVAAGVDPEALAARVVAADAHLAAEADGLFRRWLAAAL